MISALIRESRIMVTLDEAKALFLDLLTKYTDITTYFAGAIKHLHF